MRDNVFFDSNLWVYLYSDTNKCSIVIDLSNKHFDNIVISTQVLGECFNVLTRKKIKTSELAQEIIEDIASASDVAGIDKQSVIKAIKIHTSYKYSYYDSLIIASALENNGAILYTEDMHNQQVIEGSLKIVNPFVS
ncbi:MAG TPA: PIN domain-containing protein [Thioploca sp.]|nr:MAG: DNA-binding protein [Gammaproteobacteria bacterium]HDN27955.1 PIN domain-containing protein [Thioploca sp.]